MKLPHVAKGLSNAEYHANREFDSRSFLCKVAEYGGEGQKWMEDGGSLFNGNKGTSTGSEFDAIVTGILEGKSFDDTVIVAPAEVLAKNGARTTKAFEQWAADQDSGRIICTESTYRQYDTMLKHMHRHDEAKALMDATTGTQWSVFFEEFGHKLKVRPDACTPHLWWDLKTTSSSLRKIPYSVDDYGYAEQEWMYVLGAMAIGYEHFRMPFVFVQTAPPYSCRVFHLPQALVQKAGERMRSVIEDIQLRRSTGLYLPDEATMIVELEMPEKIMNKEGAVILD